MIRCVDFFRLRKARLLRTGARKTRGMTAIEFALIAPVFFMFLIGVTEVSLIMLVEHMLENAAYNASRMAKTGFIEEGKTQLETVMDKMLDKLGGLSPLIDPAKLTVTTTSYGDLSAIGQPEQGAEGLGAAGEVMVYTIAYPWKMFTPMIADLMGDENRIITLSSRIVVRNEPYE